MSRHVSDSQPPEHRHATFRVAEFRPAFIRQCFRDPKSTQNAACIQNAFIKMCCSHAEHFSVSSKARPLMWALLRDGLLSREQRLVVAENLVAPAMQHAAFNDGTPAFDKAVNILNEFVACYGSSSHNLYLEAAVARVLDSLPQNGDRDPSSESVIELDSDGNVTSSEPLRSLTIADLVKTGNHLWPLSVLAFVDWLLVQGRTLQCVEFDRSTPSRAMKVVFAASPKTVVAAWAMLNESMLPMHTVSSCSLLRRAFKVMIQLHPKWDQIFQRLIALCTDADCVSESRNESLRGSNSGRAMIGKRAKAETRQTEAGSDFIGNQSPWLLLMRLVVSNDRAGSDQCFSALRSSLKEGRSFYALIATASEVVPVVSAVPNSGGLLQSLALQCVRLQVAQWLVTPAISDELLVLGCLNRMASALSPEQQPLFKAFWQTLSRALGHYLLECVMGRHGRHCGARGGSTSRADMCREKLRQYVAEALSTRPSDKSGGANDTLSPCTSVVYVLADFFNTPTHDLSEALSKKVETVVSCCGWLSVFRLCVESGFKGWCCTSWRTNWIKLARVWALSRRAADGTLHHAPRASADDVNKAYDICPYAMKTWNRRIRSMFSRRCPHEDGRCWQTCRFCSRQVPLVVLDAMSVVLNSEQDNIDDDFDAVCLFVGVQALQAQMASELCGSEVASQSSHNNHQSSAPVPRVPPSAQSSGSRSGLPRLHTSYIKWYKSIGEGKANQALRKSGKLGYCRDTLENLGFPFKMLSGNCVKKCLQRERSTQRFKLYRPQHAKRNVNPPQELLELMQLLADATGHATQESSHIVASQQPQQVATTATPFKLGLPKQSVLRAKDGILFFAVVFSHQILFSSKDDNTVPRKQLMENLKAVALDLLNCVNDECHDLLRILKSRINMRFCATVHSRIIDCLARFGRILILSKVVHLFNETASLLQMCLTSLVVGHMFAVVSEYSTQCAQLLEQSFDVDSSNAARLPLHRNCHSLNQISIFRYIIRMHAITAGPQNADELFESLGVVDEFLLWSFGPARSKCSDPEWESSVLAQVVKRTNMQTANSASIVPLQLATRVLHLISSARILQPACQVLESITTPFSTDGVSRRRKSLPRHHVLAFIADAFVAVSWCLSRISSITKNPAIVDSHHDVIQSVSLLRLACSAFKADSRFAAVLVNNDWVVYFVRFASEVHAFATAASKANPAKYSQKADFRRCVDCWGTAIELLSVWLRLLNALLEKLGVGETTSHCHTDLSSRRKFWTQHITEEVRATLEDIVAIVQRVPLCIPTTAERINLPSNERFKYLSDSQTVYKISTTFATAVSMAAQLSPRPVNCIVAFPATKIIAAMKAIEAHLAWELVQEDAIGRRLCAPEASVKSTDAVNRPSNGIVCTLSGLLCLRDCQANTKAFITQLLDGHATRTLIDIISFAMTLFNQNKSARKDCPGTHPVTLCRVTTIVHALASMLSQLQIHHPAIWQRLLEKGDVEWMHRTSMALRDGPGKLRDLSNALP